jgi:RNA polymerase sigma-70 factor (ECF subfamily)
MPETVPPSPLHGGLWPEKEVLALVARSHGGALFRRAMRLTGRHADACDLVQDTLVRALDHGLQEIPLEKVSSWLFVVMGHLHVDRCRRAARCTVVTLEESTLPVSTSPQAAEKPLWQTLDYEDVKQCLPGLDPRIREAFVLHEEEGLSLADTARRLSVPLATAGTRVFRARRQLRTLLSSAEQHAVT